MLTKSGRVFFQLATSGQELGKILAALESGESFAAACAAVGVSDFTVSRWLARVDPPAHGDLLAAIREASSREARVRQAAARQARAAAKREEAGRAARENQEARVARMNDAAGPMPADLLPLAEAAAWAGLTPDTIREWGKRGHIGRWYRLADGVLETLVSGGQVELELQERDRRARMKSNPQARINVRRSAAWEHAEMPDKMEPFLEAVRGGDSLAKACHAFDLPEKTIRHWRKTVNAEAHPEIADFVARLNAALATGAHRGAHLRGTDVHRVRRKGERRGLDGSVVYVIGAASGEGLLKIGVTNSMPDRLRELQAGSPVPLAIVLTTRAPRSFERWIHEAFREDRRHGEWFARTPRLLRLLALLRDIPDLTAVSPAVHRQIMATSRQAVLFAPPPRSANATP
jgi:hypothetical protein